MTLATEAIVSQPTTQEYPAPQIGDAVSVTRLVYDQIIGEANTTLSETLHSSNEHPDIENYSFTGRIACMPPEENSRHYPGYILSVDGLPQRIVPTKDVTISEKKQENGNRVRTVSRFLVDRI